MWKSACEVHAAEQLRGRDAEDGQEDEASLHLTTSTKRSAFADILERAFSGALHRGQDARDFLRNSTRLDKTDGNF